MRQKQKNYSTVLIVIDVVVVLFSHTQSWPVVCG